MSTRVVIVEIMSMYCPSCQKEAPVINELYRLIEDNPRLKGTFKLIGLGAGNSPCEMKVFREKYGVPSPSFPTHGACRAGRGEDALFHRCQGGEGSLHGLLFQGGGIRRGEAVSR
jgi:thiol-disulfide isomerase/thioredoxin